MSTLSCVEKGGGAGRANKSTGHHHLVVTRYAKILHNRNKYAEHGDSDRRVDVTFLEGFGKGPRYWAVIARVSFTGLECLSLKSKLLTHAQIFEAV